MTAAGLTKPPYLLIAALFYLLISISQFGMTPNISGA
jgi:hypothetical protein